MDATKSIFVVHGLTLAYNNKINEEDITMEVSEVQKNGIMEKWIGHKFDIFDIYDEDEKEYSEFLRDAQKDLERMASEAGFHIIYDWQDSALLGHGASDLKVYVIMPDAYVVDDWYNKIKYCNHNMKEPPKICKWSDIGKILLQIVEEEEL